MFKNAHTVRENTIAELLGVVWLEYDKRFQAPTNNQRKWYETDGMYGVEPPAAIRQEVDAAWQFWWETADAIYAQGFQIEWYDNSNGRHFTVWEAD